MVHVSRYQQRKHTSLQMAELGHSSEVQVHDMHKLVHAWRMLPVLAGLLALGQARQQALLKRCKGLHGTSIMCPQTLRHHLPCSNLNSPVHSL